MPIYPSWRLEIFQCFNNFDYERPEAETVTLSTKLIKRGHFPPLCLTPSHSFRLLEWTKPQQIMHTAGWGVLFTAAGAQKTEDSMGINREHWRWHGTLMSKVYLKFWRFCVQILLPTRKDFLCLKSLTALNSARCGAPLIPARCGDLAPLVPARCGDCPLIPSTHSDVDRKARKILGDAYT